MDASHDCRVRVFCSANAERSGPELAFTCPTEDWERHANLRIPGFDSHYSLNIAGVWRLFLEKSAPVAGEATGYETIVKFGDTMQLRERFFVTIDPLT